MLPNSFTDYADTKANDTVKKKNLQTSIPMIIVGEVLHKILGNIIKQHITHHDQVGFLFLECKDGSAYKNQPV